VVHHGLVAMTAVLLAGEGIGKRMHNSNDSAYGVCVLSSSHSHIAIYRLDKTIQGRENQKNYNGSNELFNCLNHACISGVVNKKS
jgi:hypothetical protein